MIREMAMRAHVWAMNTRHDIANRDGEEGQTVTEYVIVLGVIVVGIVALFIATPIGDAFGEAVERVSDCITGAGECSDVFPSGE